MSLLREIDSLEQSPHQSPDHSPYKVNEEKEEREPSQTSAEANIQANLEMDDLCQIQLIKEADKKESNSDAHPDSNHTRKAVANTTFVNSVQAAKNLHETTGSVYSNGPRFERTFMKRWHGHKHPTSTIQSVGDDPRKNLTSSSLYHKIFGENLDLNFQIERVNK